MKKTILSILAIASAFATLAAQEKVTVNFTAPGFAKKVYIMTPDYEMKDSTEVVDGKGTMAFTAEGKQQMLYLYAVNEADSNGSKYVQFFADGPAVNIDMVAETVTGTPLNDKLAEINVSLSVLKHCYREGYNYAMAETDKAKQEVKIAAWREVASLYNDKRMELAKQNIESPIGGLFLNDTYHMMDIDTLRALYNIAKANYGDNPMLKTPGKWVAQYDKRKVGEKVKNFQMLDTKGKKRNLTDWVGKGKYVLVDFWASWCGPCLAEIPNVKAAYEKYKSAGLVVLGVSLDSKEENWKKAIEKHQLTWDHISDLKGWDSLANEVYGINAIPQMFLFSPDGTLLATDLREELLLQTLIEAFGF